MKMSYQFFPIDFFFFLILDVVFKADTGTSFGLVLMDLQQVTFEYLSAA